MKTLILRYTEAIPPPVQLPSRADLEVALMSKVKTSPVESVETADAKT